MVIRKLYVPPQVVKNGNLGVEVQQVIVLSEEPVTFASVEQDETTVAELESSDNDDVILQIKPGKIAGVQEVLPNGSGCYRFSGIPYAKPPIGELRFKPPVPLENFNDEVLDCKNERSISVTIQYFSPKEKESASEDCLFLNVYTPQLPEGEGFGGLPVMVWIHGGGFNMGGGGAIFHDPKYLVQEGVVVVTCNYRLGPLGFLYFPSMGIYGNMGLKDQRMVLKWVQDNIGSFGGDANNVTLFGESAGGASVHLNYISESSRKYFHKAICMSGVSYNQWVLQCEAEGKARHLASLLGAPSTNDEDVYDTLMRASAEDLFSNSPTVMTDDEKRTNKFFAFTPVVEPSDSEESFISENYISAMMNPNMTKISFMNGITSSEGLLIANAMLSSIHEYVANPTKLVPAELPLPEEHLKEAAEEIKRFFFGDDDITAERLQSLVDIASDNMFVMAAYVASELHARYQHDAPHYFYVASFEGELNKFKSMFQAPDYLPGVCHADDTMYLFSSSLMGTEVEPGSREDKFRSTLCKLWTNFAKCGNPTPENGGVDFVWEPVKPISDSEFILAAADLNDELKMVENPFLERIQFWRELYARYYGGHLVREG